MVESLQTKNVEALKPKETDVPEASKQTDNYKRVLILNFVYAKSFQTWERNEKGYEAKFRF